MILIDTHADTLHRRATRPGEKTDVTADRLRQGGVSVECDIAGRGLKAQMKYADKLGARYTIVVGEDELASRQAKLKDMQTGETTEIALDDSLYTTLYQKSLDRQLAGVADLFGQVAE